MDRVPTLRAAAHKTSLRRAIERLFFGDLRREEPEQPAFLRGKIDIDQRDPSL
jgi:hypothetical protein